MAETLNYYVDSNGNYYIDADGNYFIAGATYTQTPTKLHYIRYKPYFSDSNGVYTGYTAFIRQADGSYLKLKPYIYTKVEIAVAGLAIAGVSRAGGSTI